MLLDFGDFGAIFVNVVVGDFAFLFSFLWLSRWACFSLDVTLDFSEGEGAVSGSCRCECAVDCCALLDFVLDFTSIFWADNFPSSLTSPMESLPVGTLMVLLARFGCGILDLVDTFFFGADSISFSALDFDFNMLDDVDKAGNYDGKDDNRAPVPVKTTTNTIEPTKTRSRMNSVGMVHPGDCARI